MLTYVNLHMSYKHVMCLKKQKNFYVKFITKLLSSFFHQACLRITQVAGSTSSY